MTTRVLDVRAAGLVSAAAEADAARTARGPALRRPAVAGRAALGAAPSTPSAVRPASRWQADGVVRFLLLDDRYPRSVRSASTRWPRGSHACPAPGFRPTPASTPACCSAPWPPPTPGRAGAIHDVADELQLAIGRRRRRAAQHLLRTAGRSATWPQPAGPPDPSSARSAPRPVPDSSAVRAPPPDEASSGRGPAGAFTRRSVRAGDLGAASAPLGEDDCGAPTPAPATAWAPTWVGRPGACSTRSRCRSIPRPGRRSPPGWPSGSSCSSTSRPTCYGPRTLVADGLLPAEAVWGDADLVRAGPRPSTARRALAGARHRRRRLRGRRRRRRRAAGRPVAVGLDTAGLGGLGHAHENRLATAELLPGLFTRARVQRLVPFLDRLRNRLGELAGLAGPAVRSAPASAGPTSSGSVRPRAPVVILSSPDRHGRVGHADAAHLARTLGYTLAEGSDLTVRQGDVFLRSLAGPRAGARRAAPAARRPAAIRSTSTPARGQGTPACWPPACAARVALANPLGAGWLANPALEAFLPAMAPSRCSGSDLRLPGPTSWWCGDPGRPATGARLGSARSSSPASARRRRSTRRRMTADDLALARARVEAEPRGLGGGRAGRRRARCPPSSTVACDAHRPSPGRFGWSRRAASWSTAPGGLHAGPRRRVHRRAAGAEPRTGPRPCDQGHLGARRRPAPAVRPQPDRSGSTRSTSPTRCPAGPASRCTGWAATPSGPRPSCAWPRSSPPWDGTSRRSRRG